MDYILYAFSGLLIILGIVGSVLPVLPGPIIGYSGLVLLYFTRAHPFSVSFLIVFAVLTLAVTVIDYLMPVYGTKRFHGSKYGVWGSTIGVVLGMFFLPLGVILGPFAGAYVGEVVSGKRFDEALKPAFGSFVGFLAGMGMKLILTGGMAYYYVKGILI